MHTIRCILNAASFLAGGLCVPSGYGISVLQCSSLWMVNDVLSISHLLSSKPNLVRLGETHTSRCNPHRSTNFQRGILYFRTIFVLFFKGKRYTQEVNYWYIDMQRKLTSLITPDQLCFHSCSRFSRNLYIYSKCLQCLLSLNRLWGLQRPDLNLIMTTF